MRMEVLAQEDSLSVISGMEDSAMCLTLIKVKAHGLENLVCTTTNNEF